MEKKQVENICVFSSVCSKHRSDTCNQICFPFVFMHGENGHGGMWKTRGVPKKYENCRKVNLPDSKENAATFQRVRNYIEKLPKTVNDGVGLFLYGTPHPENKFGTGTGKTTAAATILNEYTIMVVMQHLKGEIKLTSNPSLFVKASDFQNLYNSQFRGSREETEMKSDSYYNMKSAMMNVKLLVIDDVAVRTGTEAFLNELYEIIDHRATEELATIFTSNIPLAALTEFFGERIVSRIEGMTVSFGFTGKDYRKKNF